MINKPFFMKQLNKMRQIRPGKRVFITVPYAHADQVLSAVECLTNNIIMFKLTSGDKLSLQLSAVMQVNEGTAAEEMVQKILDMETKKMFLHTIEPREEICGVFAEINPGSDEALVSESLYAQIPDPFRMVELYRHAEYIFPVCMREKTRRTLKHWPKPVAIITDVYFGNGDAAMIYEQMQAFVNGHKRHNKEVHVICKKATYDFFKAMLSNVQIYISSNGSYMHEAILNSPHYESVYLIPFLVSEPPLLHYTEHCAAALGFREPAPLSNKEQFTLPGLSAKGQALLDHCKSFNKPIVGFQFHTKDRKRTWPIEKAKLFCRLCEDSNLTIVNLTPAPYELGPVLDAGMLPINEIIRFIAELDIVVGIDSLCGHIAAMLDVPSITIWGRNFPNLTNPLTQPNAFISFRPLRRNYSIVPFSAETGHVRPELVHARLKSILDGSILLKEDRLTREDIASQVNTEWIFKHDNSQL